MPGNAYLSETNPARGVPNPTRVTKNLIAIGLLFALLAPPLLTGGWFQLERAGLRREARQKLLAGTAPEELVLLSFSEEEARQVLRWERDDEFEYNGHMYDVARVERVGQTVRFWCWPDGPETRLNQELEALTAQLFHDAPDPGQHTGRLLYFFKSLYFSDGMAWQPSCPPSPELFSGYLARAYAPPGLAIPPSPPRLA